MSHITIKDLPKSDRPYERFDCLGPEAMSDAELLAIIIRCGTKTRTSLDVSQEILAKCHGNILNLYEFSLQELDDISGIGWVKAIQLKAVAELSRRIVKNSRTKPILDNPESVAMYFMEDLRNKPEEHIIGVFFNSKYCYVGEAEISRGDVSCAYVNPSGAFREAILRRAVHIILLHNHPSGDCHPSEADIRLTERLVQCAALLGLDVADHIVIGDNLYYSFRENAIMPQCGK